MQYKSRPTSALPAWRSQLAPTQHRRSSAHGVAQ